MVFSRSKTPSMCIKINACTLCCYSICAIDDTMHRMLHVFLCVFDTCKVNDTFPVAVHYIQCCFYLIDCVVDTLYDAVFLCVVDARLHFYPAPVVYFAAFFFRFCPCIHLLIHASFKIARCAMQLVISLVKKLHAL